MNFFKTLLAVNKVKRQLNNLLNMVKGIVYRLDEIERDIATLKQKSHPPIFTKNQYTNWWEGSDDWSLYK